MALQSARHEAIHTETGDSLAKLKRKFDDGYHLLATDHADDHPEMAAIIYQIQKMQDELNYLRGIIDANNDKVSMTLGTSGSTALAGNTTTISTAQANAITANTAKASMVLGTTSKTALAGDTTTISTAQARDITSGALIDAKLNVTKVQANLSKSTAITFGEFTTVTGGKGGTTYSLPITVVETTIAKGGNTTITKTGSITLT